MPFKERLGVELMALWRNLMQLELRFYMPHFWAAAYTTVLRPSRWIVPATPTLQVLHSRPTSPQLQALTNQARR